MSNDMGPGVENVCGEIVCRNCGNPGAHTWQECAEELRHERDAASVRDATLVALEEALDVPYGQSALDVAKSLQSAHQTAKRLIGQVVLAVVELEAVEGIANVADKQLDAAMAKVLAAAKRMTKKAIAVNNGDT